MEIQVYNEISNIVLLHQPQKTPQKTEETSTTFIRKGPWLAEEDAILLDYVNRFGPRDWSSIRSKGLLPRTGKSCRLRWVNKLKPDLKTGCKFSAEEERVVIDLQARFGNKWARIATHLPGRTDNDVKNFWSTRQKRLAKHLQVNFKVSIDADVSTFEPNVTSTCADPHPLSQISLTEDQNSIEMALILSLIESPTHLQTENHDLIQQNSPNSSPPSDLPILSEKNEDLIFQARELNSLEQFDFTESFELLEFPSPSSLFADNREFQMDYLGSPESFFGDFPADLFDYLDPPPAC